jgi:hypothetical protein
VQSEHDRALLSVGGNRAALLALGQRAAAAR